MGETEANHKQYQLEHIHENKTPTIVGVYCLGFVLAVTAVCLRFFSRKISDLPYLADDWVILVALILFIALFGVDIWHVVGGHLGQHAIAVTHEEVVVFLKSLYVFNPLYTNIIPLVKISILLLYRRLFPLAKVHTILYILIGILACFEISTTFVDIFNCRPIAASWDKSIKNSKCVVPQTLYMATAGINLTTDIIILVLPMPLVWRLRLSFKRKIAVSFIFILGSLVCVTTIFRIATFHNINSYDLTWSYIDTAYWTYSELCLSFICACVPTFRPVINHFTNSIPQFILQPASLAGRKLSSLGMGSGSKSSGSNNAKKNRQGSSPKQHPVVTFDSLGLPRQRDGRDGRDGRTGLTVSTLSSTGFERIEDPNSYEAKAFGGSDGKDSAKHDNSDDSSGSHSTMDVEMGQLPVQGIRVKKELNQTEGTV